MNYSKSIKLLENIRVNLHDYVSGNGFLARTPKTQATKEKKQVNWVSSRLFKNLCIKGDYQESEKTTNRMGENFFAN